ncbi:MAG: FtsX-like permease family protein [Fulvivirga sp.]|uniref:ABC transporter permease n=1 Tax=Fulvivirga sp. TaxID=1931237 RepID=UPI0032ED060B
MIRNYLITTLRNLTRNATNTVINVVGLSLGIGCAIILFLLAAYSNSYNTFEDNYDRIYRLVNSSDGQGGQRDYTTGVPTPLPYVLKEELSDVEQIAHVRDHYEEMMFTVNPDSQSPQYFELRDRRLAFTENSYFYIFTKKWLAGDKSTALLKPGSTVISESVAKQLFPNGNALGQSVIFNKTYELVIDGIVSNQPENSDMPHEIFISLKTLDEKIEDGSWGSVSSNDQCYMLFPEGVVPTESFQERIMAIRSKFVDNDNNSLYEVQPMSDLHFNEKWSNLTYDSITRDQLMVIVIVAIFLLITACINFVNLSTAIAVKRSKEVGIRKVLGGTKKQLALQFLSEAFFIVLISVIVGIGISELILIYLNPFLEINLDISFSDITFLGLLGAGTLIITFLAGFYPSLVLSGFKPALALKNKITNKHAGGISLRKGLVVFQFFISQVFIMGTLIVLFQMDYLKERDLGFSKDAIIHTRIPEPNVNKHKTLKTELAKLAGVEEVSTMFSPPSSGSVAVSNFKFEDSPEDFYTAMKYADEDFLEIYDIQLLAGRNIQQSDTLNEVVVNEKLLKYVGFEGTPRDAIGKQMKIYGKNVPIVGVMKDFHSVSLHDELMTITLFSEARSYRAVAIKVNMASFKSTNDKIKQAWKSLYPEYDYEYEFYDKQLQEFYESEQQLATVFSFFSGIAIIVGCLGLFGLASFMTNQKVKEIGVRKTLGATVMSIVGMFSVSFLKLIIIAFVFAVPLTWYALNHWLQNFQYRIDISPQFYAIGLVATVFVAMLTVGYKSIKAATANPVQCLRDE